MPEAPFAQTLDATPPALCQQPRRRSLELCVYYTIDSHLSLSLSLSFSLVFLSVSVPIHIHIYTLIYMYSYTDTHRHPQTP